MILILSSHSGHTDTSHTATPLSPYRARGLGQFIENVFLKDFCFSTKRDKILVKYLEFKFVVKFYKYDAKNIHPNSQNNIVLLPRSC